MSQNRESNDWSSGENWTIAQGEHEMGPIFIRANIGACSLVGERKLPYRLGIAIPFLAPTPDGLPGSNEVDLLDDLEDAIQETLHGSNSGVVVLVITTNGMREFVSYVRHESAAREVVLAVERAATSHEVQDYVEVDPEWALYTEITADFE